MDNKVKEVFKTFEKIKKNGINSMPKVSFNGTVHNFMFLKDVAAEFKKIAGKELNLSWFLKECVKKQSPFIVNPIFKPASAMGYSILYERNSPSNSASIAKTIMQEITKDIHANRVVRAKSVMPYSIVCSEEDDAPIATKESSSSETWYGKKEEVQAASIPGLDVTKNYIKSDRFCEFSDSDSDGIVSIIGFKSPLVPTSPATVTPKDVKAKISCAFDKCPIIAMDNFQLSYCQMNGNMFDYRTEVCPIPKHPHGNLSKFLGCFKDLLVLKQLRKLYLVNVTPQVNDYCAARFAAYFKKESDPLFKVGVEALFTSIFPLKKTTLQLDDFAALFTMVYKNPIKTLCPYTSPQQFISDLNSPNVVIVKKNDVYNLTITPLRSESFKDWQPADCHKKIGEIEASILNGVQSSVKMEKEINVPFIQGPNRLIEIARWNIPGCVQVKSMDTEEFAFDHSWAFLHANVKFEEGRTFFN